MKAAALQRIAALAGLLLAGALWAQPLQTIELQHRSAQDVIPILQPLLEPGGALSGQDHTLFVRTSSENLGQLRAALEKIDRAPRQLVVSVRRSTRREVERENARLEGAIRAGEATVSVDQRPRRSSGATVYATDARRRSRDDGVSSVRVLEGGSALISSGQSVPVVTAIAAGHGGRRGGHGVAAVIDWRNVGSGFLVTPRVSGDMVVLQIEQGFESVRGAGIETQSLSTQVSARLGEWLELGGVSDSASVGSVGLAGRRYETRTEERGVWIRVEADGE
ncbi:MAG TPA: secretin N-terminal domain-containing protein [Steroidobacter sp.]|jgi:type II secretory pathway component GspD/PulD (secretin)|nr:hypothetical protein [Steroidobacteraceae bacterium]HLS82865.1 secretin N-terminal domain-containing protein [Steroidobacter sp.]